MSDLEHNRISAHVRALLIVAGVAGALAGAFALLSGFCTDDFVQLWHARAPYLSSIWSSIAGPDMFSSAYYRPLTRVVQRTAFALFDAHAIWHHLLSLSVHLLNTVLAFRLFRRLDAPREAALIAAAVFAIHPAQVETVTFVSAFGGLGAGTCVLLALTAYVDYLKSNATRPAILAIVFTAAGLLFKEDVITVPLSMVAVWWVYATRRNRQWWPPAVMIPIILSWLTVRLCLGGTIDPGATGFTVNPLAVARNVMFHLVRFVVPVRTLFRVTDFDAYFKLRDALPPTPHAAIYILLVVVLAAGFTYVSYRVWRTLPRHAKAGLLIGFAGMALYYFSVESATRYLYVPIAGWSLAAVGWAHTHRSRLAKLLLMGWIVVLGIAVVEQSSTWYGAGKRVQVVLNEAVKIRERYPEQIGTVLLDYPRRYYAAYVFPIGLEYAVDLRTDHRWPYLYVPYDLPSDRAANPDSILWFEWVHDRFELVNPPDSLR